MNENILEELLALEKAALDKWIKGNPDGFLELSAPEVVYFDPFLDKKLNNFEELKKLYDSIRGQVAGESYEIICPVVHAGSDMAVLCYNFASNETPQKWNCSEVYKKQPDGGWKIIHTHWSIVKPLG